MKLDDKNVSEKDIYTLKEDDKKEEPKETPKEKKNKSWKYFFYLAFILIVTGVVLAVSLTQGNTAEQIYVLFQEMNWKYFTLLCIAIVFNFGLCSFILWLYVKLYSKHYRYHQAMANQAIGTFYNGVTPGSSGGQVAQIYTFKKQGVTLSNAASVMVMSYIVYQSCLIIMGIISVATHAKDFLSFQTIDITINGAVIPIPITIFIVLGFTLNLMVIVLLMFMSTSNRFQSFICGKGINFLAKIHIVKHPDETRLNVQTQVENFRVEFRRLQSNIPFTILVSILTFVSLIITDAYPFFCGLALNGFESFKTVGETVDKIFLSVVYTNFHQMITGLIPLPGSSGISEYIFVKLFGSYFNAANFATEGGINAVMLLWRFMTFHIPFLICGIVSATYKTRGIPKEDRIMPTDKKTYYTIQMETYDERKATSDMKYKTSMIGRKEEIAKKIFDKNSKKDEIPNDKNSKGDKDKK